MQSQEQSQPTQPVTERTIYRTPKLMRYGKLASIVEGGTTPSGGESTTVFFSSTV